MAKKTQKILLEIIYFGSVLILLLPLLVLKTTIYPFVFPKIIFFQIIVEVIFAVWLGLAIYEPKYRPHKKNPLLISLLVFLGVLIVSSIFGLDVQRSFYSTQERMMGVLTWLHLLAWFIVLFSVFQSDSQAEKKVKGLIWTTLIASFLVGLYGIGQRLGLSFLIESKDPRMASTLGNPIFMGAYAMLNFFLGIFLFFQEKKKIRFLSLILGLFNLAVMFLAASRGVMLATIIGIIFILGAVIFSLKKTKLKYILVVFFLILIGGSVLGIILLQGKSLPSETPLFLRRLANLSSSAKDRLLAWKIGFLGFKDRPLFGWGWANYNLIFNKYYSPYFLEKGLSATWFDHSHNQLLDILSLSGIFGFLSYLAIFLAVIFLWIKALKQKERKEKIALSILLALAISYFVQNLFVFDSPAPVFVFILSLAIFSFYSQEDKKDNVVLEKKGKDKFPVPVFVFLVLLFLSFSLWQFNLFPLEKSKEGARAVQSSKIDFNQSIYWFEQSLAGDSFTNPEIRALLAQVVSQNKPPKISQDSYKIGLNFAITEMEKSVEEHPLDCRYWLYLGQLYGLSNFLDEKNLDFGEQALKKALALSPERQEIYYGLIQLFILKGEKEEALDWARKVVVLNGDIGQSWWHLGVAYLMSGEDVKATKVIDKATWELNYYEPGLDKYFASAYKEAGNYERAFYFCDKSFYYDPQDLEAGVFCYLLAKEKGQSEKMNYYFSKIKEQDENLAQQLQ